MENEIVLSDVTMTTEELRDADDEGLNACIGAMLSMGVNKLTLRESDDKKIQGKSVRIRLLVIDRHEALELTILDNAAQPSASEGGDA